MLAMVVERPGAPLVARDRPTPEPGPDEVLVRVHALSWGGQVESSIR